MFSRFLTDARQAWRGARRQPLTLSFIILTVALITGAGSAVFAVANAALIRPLPFPAGESLARIHLFPPGVSDFSQANPLHPLDFVRLQQRLTLADGPGGITPVERSLGDEGDPASVSAAQASAALFEVLGVAPALGRTFTVEEDRDNAPVAVISDTLWRSRFGADAGVIGRMVRIDRVSHEIIGVMPPGFEPAYVPSDLWTPLGIHDGRLDRPNATFIVNVVRLRPGTSLRQLEAEVRSILAAVAEESPVTMHGWTGGVRSLREAVFGTQTTPVLLLVGGVIVLAAIGIANLMNLTLARMLGRGSELRLRFALGARRRDLLRAAATEATVVAIAGGAIGLLLAALVTPVLIDLDPVGIVARQAVTVDWRVFASTLTLSLVVTLASSLLPIARLASGRRSLAVTADRTASHGPSLWWRAALITGQTALALVLLSSSLLLLQGFDRTAGTDPGFDPRHVLGAQLRLPEAVYASPAVRTTLLDGVLESIRSVPGIVSAASTMNLFQPGFQYVTLVHTDDPPVPDAVPHTVQFRRVSDGYFETMRIPLLRGRDFTAADREGTEPVAIVSRLFANQYYAGADPVGRRVVRGAATSPPTTIVGLVSDVSDVGYGQAPGATIYLPYRQTSLRTTPISLVVRTESDPRRRVDAIARAVRAVDPAQPLSRVTTLEDFLRDSLGAQRFRATLIGAFAALGLLLSAVGIYGMTARSVIERRREVGIRLALGGAPRAIWWTVARRSLSALVLGAAAGAALTIASTRVLTSYFAELADVPASAGWPAAILLALAGAAAALIPARRATRVDAVETLRG